MEANDDLIRRKINDLEKALIIETGAGEKFKLREDIKEMKAMLTDTGQPSPTVNSITPAFQAKTPQIGSIPETIPAELPSQNKKVPWWAISLAVAVASILVSWWMIASLKIAVLIGIVAFVLLLFRDPDRSYLRLAQLSMGLVIALNAINISGILKGKLGENEIELQLTEPSIFVSLFLIVFAGYMMYLHSKR
jgi:hypothetical protein